MHKLLFGFCLFFIAACHAKVYEIDVKTVEKLPHNPSFFTQGYLFYENNLYETTGQWGKSALYQYDGTQNPIQKIKLKDVFFGEGLAELDGYFYWLSWRAGLAWKIDTKTMAISHTFHYEGQGWGLTSDGKQLIMSNGSSEIVFRDNKNFNVTKAIEVRYKNKPIRYLNELEWINGYIYANIWHTDNIAKIDPSIGEVLVMISAKALRKHDDIPKKDVLNGIAYNADTGKALITGKNWPFAYWVDLP